MSANKGPIEDVLTRPTLQAPRATNVVATSDGVREGLTAIGIMLEDRSSEDDWKMG